MSGDGDGLGGGFLSAAISASASMGGGGADGKDLGGDADAYSAALMSILLSCGSTENSAMRHPILASSPRSSSAESAQSCSSARMSVSAGGDVSPHMESRFVRWTSGMVLSSTSLSMVVYSFMHLPGATVRVRGLGDGRPEMSVRLHARLRVVVRALLGEARVE